MGMEILLTRYGVKTRTTERQDRVTIEACSWEDSVAAEELETKILARFVKKEEQSRQEGFAQKRRTSQRGLWVLVVVVCGTLGFLLGDLPS